MLNINLPQCGNKSAFQAISTYRDSPSLWGAPERHLLKEDRMSVDDRAYYESRAEAELALAQQAEHPAVVKAHYILAGTYLDIVYGDAEPTKEHSAQ